MPTDSTGYSPELSDKFTKGVNNMINKVRATVNDVESYFENEKEVFNDWWEAEKTEVAISLGIGSLITSAIIPSGILVQTLTIGAILTGCLITVAAVVVIAVVTYIIIKEIQKYTEDPHPYTGQGGVYEK